jgi:cytochrome c-type protein NapB
MASMKRGPNAQWTNDLSKLPPPKHDLLADVQVDDRAKGEALDRRAQRRAYDGAPPQVPHPIDQMSSSSCLACHGEGALVAGRRAPRLSHAAYTSCTQCHVPLTPMMAGTHAELSRPMASSGFQGLDAPRAGARAYFGAPPTVPHSTWMRNDCLSCHGPGAEAGLKTTHPWRQNCLQCHAPSAELDQHRFDGDLASFPANAEIQAWLQTLPSPAAN